MHGGEVLSKQDRSEECDRKSVVLRDGRRMLLRPIEHADGDAIRALFDRLSFESRFLRFHYQKPGLTEEEVEGFCGMDYERDFALVAEIVRQGRSDIVGVGRCCRVVGSDAAELDFVVEDAEQGHGIATELLNLLAKIAQEKGVRRFVAELLRENTHMLHIFRKYAPDLEVVTDGSSWHLTFSGQRSTRGWEERWQA